MYIIKVIPFVRSLRKETLSYFSTTKIDIGSIVTIDIRNKATTGLVIESIKGDYLKSELKKSQFKLKKIKSVSTNTLINKKFIIAAEETANYFATSTGSILRTFISAKILSDIEKLKNPKIKDSKNKENKVTSKKISGKGNAKYIIQDQHEERYSQYKNLIREEFAKNHSVLFVCPTQEDVLQAQTLLSKGIEKNVCIFHSSLGKGPAIKEWNNAVEHSKPILIITTSAFISTPRHDIGLIIVEKEGSKAYKTQKRPYVNIQYLLEKYAQSLGARFIAGDIMLRSETLWRYDQNEFYEMNSLKFRSLSSASQQIIDMKKDKHNAGKLFSVFSNEVNKLIEHTREKHEHTFFFVARKGLAPTIVCSDCGTLVTCNSCEASVVLHGKDATKKDNYFKCRVCGDERHAGERCSHCTSWNLQTLGIGTETITEELKEKYPDNKFFTLNADSAKTPKQARAIIDEFYDTPGSILIGTEMAILYLRESIENSAIISIDALFGIPDFSIREKILRTLLTIRSKSNNTFYIQTRKAEDKIFEYAKQGNLSDFYREEFADRNKFKYPPFSLIIKISLGGTRYAVTKEFENLQKYFKDIKYDLISYPSFSKNNKGMFVMNGIIKLKRDVWINKKLRDAIMALPPQFKIVIDTDNLL